MNGKILTSLAAVAVASSLTGAGLFAFFSEEVTSTGNTFGTDDILFTIADGDEGAGATVATSFTTGTDALVPGVCKENDLGSVTLTGTYGDIDGVSNQGHFRLDLRYDAVTDADDIGQFLLASFSYNGVALPDTTLDAASFEAAMTGLDAPDETGSELVMTKLCLDEDADNDDQGATFAADLRFHLRQDLAGATA